MALIPLTLITILWDSCDDFSFYDQEMKALMVKQVVSKSTNVTCWCRFRAGCVWLQSRSNFLGRSGSFPSIFHGVHSFQSRKPTGAQVDVYASGSPVPEALDPPLLDPALSPSVTGISEQAFSAAAFAWIGHKSPRERTELRFSSMWTWLLTGICLTPKTIILSCAFYSFLDKQCENCETMDSTHKWKWLHFKSLKATAILF